MMIHAECIDLTRRGQGGTRESLEDVVKDTTRLRLRLSATARKIEEEEEKGEEEARVQLRV